MNEVFIAYTKITISKTNLFNVEHLIEKAATTKLLSLMNEVKTHGYEIFNDNTKTKFNRLETRLAICVAWNLERKKKTNSHYK